MATKPANENTIPTEEILDRLDWVRPVIAIMRAQNIPEEVAQRTMTYLLEELDDYLAGPIVMHFPKRNT